jgi:hypothetical protein
MQTISYDLSYDLSYRTINQYRFGPAVVYDMAKISTISYDQSYDFTSYDISASCLALPYLAVKLRWLKP